MEKIKKAVKKLKDELNKGLSCFISHKDEQCSYEVKERDFGEMYVLFIIPTDKRYPFITMFALETVRGIYETSKWKEYMFYGVETYTYTDIHTGEITLPCISVHIYSEKI